MQRYFAHDFDRVSDRLFDAGRSGAVEVAVRVSHVVCSNAVLHALSRYSNAVLDRTNQRRLLFERRGNALVLSLGSFVGPKIDWTDSDYQDK